MKVDSNVDSDMNTIASRAKELEEIGYSGLRIAELNHDPFMPLAIAASKTDSIELITSVAVAFSRNPMSMATLAHDLNAFSNGRFILGLGSQVKPHIERRFSMPRHKAAAQMREFIEAMHAIFSCWYEGERLQYEGEYYQHTLMPDTFKPDTQGLSPPRITLSATGPLMTKLAAEIADGMMMHPFSSERYLKEVTLPAIKSGLHNSGRDLESFELDYAPMIASADSEEELQRAIGFIKSRIAFYGCTVAYRPVLEIHGWGDLQEELIALNRQHRTKEMSDLITDEILETIAIVGKPEAVVDKMIKRFDGCIGRTGFAVGGLEPDRKRELIEKLRLSDG